MQRAIVAHMIYRSLAIGARHYGLLAMKFSMNGFRKQLSADIAELRDLVKDSINMQLHDADELVDAMNRVITHSNVVNCVYNNDDHDFSDISHIEIDHLDMSDGENE